MNEKTFIRVWAVEDKTARTGRKYTRFKISENQDIWASAFDESIINQLKNVFNNGNEVQVLLAKDRNFINIRKIFGYKMDKPQLKTAKEVEKEQEPHMIKIETTKKEPLPPREQLKSILRDLLKAL